MAQQIVALSFYLNIVCKIFSVTSAKVNTMQLNSIFSLLRKHFNVITIPSSFATTKFNCTCLPKPGQYFGTENRPAYWYA